MSDELDVFPIMVRNWTAERVVLAPNALEITASQRRRLDELGVAVHVGDIVSLDHEEGKLRSVTLDSGEVVKVATLLFTLRELPTPLVMNLVPTFGLRIDANRYVAVDESQRTNVDRLWAAGDVEGWMGGIESANAGGMAASMIVHDWYTTTAPVTS